MTTRRDRFRTCLARLDVAASAESIIGRNLHVERAGSVASRIAPLVDVSPTSLYALVGGIGTGKTTELLLAQARLGSAADVETVYVDVSVRQDLAALRPGSILAVLAEALADRPVVNASPGLARSEEWFRNWAYGYHEEWHPEYDEPPGAWVPGVVTRPAGLSAEIARRAEQFAVIRESRVPLEKSLVFFVDAVDRLDDMRAFGQFVANDLSALEVAKAGAVVACPMRALYGVERQVLDRFNDVVNLPFVDVRDDEPGCDFLCAVLARRAGEVISREVQASLVRWSGGVLRDVLQLASLAVREAFLRGADNVEERDVNCAVDALGRTLSLGLVVDDAILLSRLHIGEVRLGRTEREMELLVSRRVLAYDGGASVVHPALVPMLAKVAAP